MQLLEEAHKRVSPADVTETDQTNCSMHFAKVLTNYSSGKKIIAKELIILNSNVLRS